MSNKILEVLLKDSKAESQEDKNQLEEILQLISEMNIVELEPHIDEDVNQKKEDVEQSGKYEILTVLRDLFVDFKNSGDTSVNLEMGSCYSECYENCNVINLCGSHSGKNFAFVIDKNDDKIMQFHTCPFFIDSNKEFKKIDKNFLFNARKNVGLMNGEDEESYNDNYKTQMIKELELVYKTTIDPELKNTWDSIMKIAKKVNKE